MTDIPTILSIAGAVLTVLIWLGRKLISATTATVNLTNEIKGLRSELNDKADREAVEHWIERMGYLNPSIRVPSLPAA